MVPLASANVPVPDVTVSTVRKVVGFPALLLSSGVEPELPAVLGDC